MSLVHFVDDLGKIITSTWHKTSILDFLFVPRHVTSTDIRNNETYDTCLTNHNHTGNGLHTLSPVPFPVVIEHPIRYNKYFTHLINSDSSCWCWSCMLEQREPIFTIYIEILTTHFWGSKDSHGVNTTSTSVFKLCLIKRGSRPQEMPW